MSEPAPNAFIGRAEAPTDADLAATLGAAKRFWDELIADMADRHGVAVQEWRSYSRKTGWALRLKRGKRTILRMAPCEGCCDVRPGRKSRPGGASKWPSRAAGADHR